MAFRIRKYIGLAALACLAGLIVTSNWSAGPADARLERAVAPLLAPLAVTISGLWREAYWSRWLALAAGVGLLPWAAALAVTPTIGHSVLPWTLVAAAVTLVGALTGRKMCRRYEGRFGGVTWSGPRMTLISWTIICNVASALSLYLFVVAYDHSLAWHLIALAWLLACLVAGAWLLARGRTAGLLVVALASLCLVPVGAHFVWQEATLMGEAVLFALLFLPGILTSWACLMLFSGPIWRILKSS